MLTKARPVMCESLDERTHFITRIGVGHLSTYGCSMITTFHGRGQHFHHSYHRYSNEMISRPFRSTKRYFFGVFCLVSPHCVYG